MEKDQRPLEAYGPPAVVLDDEGVTSWLGGEPYQRILWSQIELVEVSIVTVPDADYSEAFWGLRGAGLQFAAPVEVVVNGDQLTEKLLALPGFDMGAYRRARDAEARGEGGEFLCWLRSSLK